MADNATRVNIWNTFFHLAWAQAKRVFEFTKDCSSSDRFTPKGDTLGENESHVIATLVYCVLSIEARANHLIAELEETGKITRDVAEAVRWLPPKQKWFLLPSLAGAQQALSSDSGPHQAVAQICDLRNDLVHVRWNKSKSRLPSATLALSYFERFVAAVDDMNGILGRRDTPGPDSSILSIGKFRCADGSV